MSKIRNDSPFLTEHVLSELGAHGVSLQYGGMELKVFSTAIKEAVENVNDITADELDAFRDSVERALRKSLPKMLSGRFSKKVADNFCLDLCLWEALKRRAN